jgi:ABC-type glycerol-3-phosphate transport system permease component
MKINLPKKSTFYISLVLAVLGLLGALGVSFLAGFAFWLLFAGYAVLVAGLFLKGF